jgi:hypothetical protein
LALLDGISHDLAMAEAEGVIDRPETPEERASIDRLQQDARALFQRLRREAFEELRSGRREPERRGIPARIAAMAREAIVARLREIEVSAPGSLQVAFRKLDELTLHELRVVLTDVEDALAEAAD